MAALATTITVLGAVTIFEPVNGYQLRRELQSWQLEQWAGIKPGSVYSMLSTLTRAGHVERHDVDDDGRTVAVYTTTTDGRDTLRRLLSRALTEADPLSPLPFHVAVMFSTLLPRAEYERCLTIRRQRLDELEDGLRIKLAVMSDGAVPPQALEVVRLSLELTRTESAWVSAHLARMASSEFAFADDERPWMPPADDLAWQLTADRQRYLALLASRRG